MEVRVPRISERTIEAQAISLLERYDKEHEPIRKPPVPVDEIPEMVLKVRLEFDDLRKLLGRKDAIGATWFETSEIYIDQSLDPTDHPRKRGRYRFTVGHEIGHWVLHRRFVPDRASQLDLFEGRTPEPSILCRESSKREPAEWQADRFASFLLMPKHLVVEAWRAHRGRDPWVFDLPKYRAAVANGFTDTYDTVAKTMMNHIAEDLAGDFAVSVEAMRIRLENLGFLVKMRSDQLLDMEAAG
jgi:Zn-dependent peptidase ImmA (M78 family)